MSDTPPPNLPDAADEADVETDSEVEKYAWRIGKNMTRRIDQYLVDRVPYLSRNAIQKLVEEGLVKVNGKITKSSYKPRENDQVEMVAPPKPVSELVPENIPLEIVYEDDHMLALNKQKDLIVHPARGKWTGTLVNALVYYGNKWSKINGDWRPGILHRLDRNTTGIMLVAKSDEAHWRLARQFENRTIQKTYMAVVHGIPELLSDVIDMPIGHDRYVREKMAVRKIESGAREAVTIYQVIEKIEKRKNPRNNESGRNNSGKSSNPAQKQKAQAQAMNCFDTVANIVADPSSALPASHDLHSPSPPSFDLLPSTFENDRHYPLPKEDFAVVKLSPKTGRTHQLRVHMSHLGYPIVGDTMYGGRVVETPSFRFDRQALHAYEITFTHPVTLQPMTLSAPLPADIQMLISLIRGEH